MTKYAQTFGDGVNTNYTITHDLGTRDIVVALYDVETGEAFMAGITVTSENAISLGFGQAPPQDAYRVVVVG